MNTKTRKSMKSKPFDEKAFDAMIERRNIVNHERLAFAIATAVKLDPRIEWEIVSNYLKIHGYVLQPQADADAELARALRIQKPPR